MGKTPVRMKAVVYALSPFQQKVMPGLWKDITTKIHHKVSANWISATLLPMTAFWGTQSVDTMLKLDEETLISGASDGVIRLVGILPNRIIQPLAEHSEYPIEALVFSNDRKYLGSISHDKLLKLWDLQELLSGPQLVHGNELVESDGDDSDDDEMDVDMEPSSSKGLVSSFDCHCSLDVFH